MSARIETGYEQLGPATANEIDRLCDEFESAWKRGERPAIENVLDRANGTVRSVLLRELVLLEIGFRRRAGDSPAARDYAGRFAELSDSWLNRALTPSTREFTGATMRSGLPPTGPVLIPGFEIIGELGRGGMGVVYKARDVHLQRIVALKTLIGGSHAAAAEREQFRREAEAIAQLDHPNIVPVYEVGEVNGCPYFSMKYYAGGSLARRERPAEPVGRDIANLLATTARAVHHAHLRGVLHRDLKPSNILLDDDGQPHVADFGLAKRFDPRAGPGDASTVAGTPGYMAPEQAAGRGDLTTATDVYGLGAILYELLAGQPPFDSDSPLALLRQVMEEQPPRITALNPRIPRDLETIALKCLEKDPRRRYATAQDLADDLDRWRQGRPIIARPTPGWERVWRWMRRHPVPAGLTCLSIATLAALLVALIVSYERVSRSLKHEREMRVELSLALAREQKHLYIERIGSANRLWMANQTARAEQLLDLCPIQLRNWEWHFLDRLRRPDCVKLADNDVVVSSVAESPDGSMLATTDFDGRIRIWDSATLTLIRSWHGPPFSLRTAFSPDGRYLLTAERSDERDSLGVWDVSSGASVRRIRGGRWVDFSRDGTLLATVDDASVLIYEWPSAELKYTFNGHARGIWIAIFDHHGRQVLSTGADKSLRFWNLTTGRPAREPMALEQNCFSLKLLPENRLLVAQQTDSMILDLPSARELERAPSSVFGADRMAVSADGQRLAWPSRDGTIRVWNCQSREDEFRFRGQPAHLNNLLFTRDGRRLISVGQDSTIRVWGFSRATDARMLCRVRAVGGLAFSHDGRRIAIATSNAGSHGIETGRVRIHDVTTGDELHRLDAVGDVAFSSDDRWLVTNRSDGSAALWDTASWQPVRRFYSPGVHSMRVAISPDRRRLVCGTEKGIILAWDLTTDGPPTILEGHTNLVTALAFASDGARFASCDRMGKVILWDRDLREISTWQVSQNLQRLAFSPDGRRLALAGGSQYVTIWDCATGTELTRLHGHTAWVWGLAYMPDGARIVTSGADDTVRIWDADSGQELLSLPGVRYNAAHIAVSPDGLRIAAGDTSLRLWEIDPP